MQSLWHSYKPLTRPDRGLLDRSCHTSSKLCCMSLLCSSAVAATLLQESVLTVISTVEVLVLAAYQFLMIWQALSCLSGCCGQAFSSLQHHQRTWQMLTDSSGFCQAFWQSHLSFLDSCNIGTGCQALRWEVHRGYVRALNKACPACQVAPAEQK